MRLYHILTEPSFGKVKCNAICVIIKHDNTLLSLFHNLIVLERRFYRYTLNASTFETSYQTQNREENGRNCKKWVIYLWN